MELNRSSKEVSELKNKCFQKFLKAFPRGFSDSNFLSWERDYKWQAHERWQAELNQKEFKKLMTDRDYDVVTMRALAVENRTNFLDANEKMGLRDAIKNADGAEIFSKSLYQLLYGTSDLGQRFNQWCQDFRELPGIKSVVVAPRNKDKVFAWPVLTVFGFLARPSVHALLRPEVVLEAARAYGFQLHLGQNPNWSEYAHYLHFCEELKRDLSGIHPRDLIDIQSFIWVLGSNEY